MTFEYAPAPESRAIVSIKPKYGHFINGSFVSGKKHFPTINPATEEILSHIALGGTSDVDKAVAAAQKAYTKTWSKLSGKERGKYLYRIARILQERAREFAVLETLDNGKPIRETRDIDIPLVAAHFFYHAGWADKLDYAGLGQSPQPHGVAGQIIPWNFPLLMLAWKVAPALATGNTVVLKPAETTSLTALLFAEVCQQAELPDGVVNIITGDGSTGAAIVNHPGIHKIAFTGSTDVGKKIARAIASTDKKATLELGGKGANIVFDDAPVDETVEGIVNGIFFNQGHVCCAGSRLILQESIAEEIIEKLKVRMSKIRVGDPLERWSPQCNLSDKGFWFAPTIFTGVTQAHRIAQEEIFGPVLSVLTFRTPQEGIDKANNTPFGLSAGIWSEKGSRIFWASQHLKAGVIWANTFNKFDPASPFGGYKESGWGREGGRHGLAAYLKNGKESGAK
jgi:acyl-CoA reductase-like NAD-dependent aldehyde dehydrogenase